jgi:hypothetical protein
MAQVMEARIRESCLGYDSAELFDRWRDSSLCFIHLRSQLVDDNRAFV